MSLIDTARNALAQRPARPRANVAVATYEDARANALALAPQVRAGRATCEAFPGSEARPMLPRSARLLARIGAAGAGAAGAMLLAPGASGALLLGAALGLALAATADRLGAALRGLAARREWPARAALAAACLVHATEAGALTIAGALLAQSTLAAGGLALITAGVATAGYATRVGDDELEMRAAMRKGARERLAAAEGAMRRAVDALQAAHAADLARIAAELGRPPEGAPDAGARADRGMAAMDGASGAR
ncbi:MAG: hypothetical protein M5U07_16640 [Xanthobacteraceae bacterium]|nr:hypothetical protein [Xanthobacteraceae bacterium]